MDEAIRTLKAGDPVRVFDVNGKHYRQPPGGWPGKVDKVGRLKIYVTHPHHHRPQAFRLEDGHSDDRMSHQWIETVAYAEAAGVRAARRKVLSERGVRLELWHNLSDDELAAVAAVVGGGQPART